jgi:Cu-processing system permease protein
MSSILQMIGETLREARRRKIFLIVPIMSLGFIAIYAIGNYYAFRDASGISGSVDTRSLAGATLVGLSMFVSLFLGSALGIFLSFSLVRGDAEVGTLQQLVVRPLARRGVLIGRFVGASLICATYVLIMYALSVGVIGIVGDWWPDPLFAPGVTLALGVCVVIALTLLGSCFLTALSNGIVMFMLYGAALLAGLLGQLGNALNSVGLETTARVVSRLLPFEALYQAALDKLTAGTTGLARVIVQLGPLGGAEPGGPGLTLFVGGYVAAVLALAIRVFERRDL